MLQRYEKGGEKGASVRALAPDFFRHWSRFSSLPRFPAFAGFSVAALFSDFVRFPPPAPPPAPPPVLPLIPPLVPPFVLRSPWLFFFASVNSSAACPAPPRPLRPALLSHQLFRGLLPRTFRALPNLLCPPPAPPPVLSSLFATSRPVPSSASAASVPFSLLAAARPARLFPAPDDVPPVLLRKPLRTPRCPPFTRSGTPSPPRCARSVRPRRPVTSFRPKNCPIVREKMQKITLPALSRFLIVIFFTFLKVFIPLCRRTPCCGPLPAGARGDDRARRRNALTTTGQRI